MCGRGLITKWYPWGADEMKWW